MLPFLVPALIVAVPLLITWLLPIAHWKKKSLFWGWVVCLLPAVSMVAYTFWQATNAPSSTAIAPLFTPQVQRFNDLITSESIAAGVDPNAIATIIQIESCGNPAIVSPAGAIGLGQVMPFHFAPNETPTDPVTNIRRAIAYYKERLNASTGDSSSAFAQYNGGPRAANPANRVAETIAYVKWATGIYADAQQGATHSDTLQAWLEAGGQSLCDKAGQFRPIDWPYLFRPSLSQTWHGLENWEGVDMTGGCGATLTAPFDGVVTFNGRDGYIGPYSDGEQNTMFTITSTDGRLAATLLHGLYTAKIGQAVRQGQTIGEEAAIGNTYSTGGGAGCHTHFIIKVDGRTIDPLTLFP